MKIYLKILIGVVIAAFAVFALFMSSAKPVEGITDRDNYQFGDSLEISIKNNLGQEVCFSSCYPYLSELRNAVGAWEQYKYDDCPEADVAVDCIPANALKKFKLLLSDAQRGLNRLKLPVCVDCVAGQEFKANSVLYSNTFEVK